MSDIEPHAVPITSLPWMSEAATRAVMAALGEANARFVGGCVRDALLGRPVLDIDIATKLPPDEVTRRLEAAGIRAVPTGLAHGTVTAVLKPRHFEITTLRRDVETFGRHARVAFTDDWAEDAGRRDFTMNALYLSADGAVFDPIGGLADLREGRVRFVGDAGRRIDEDVLRLLRFYRFYAHYGKGEADEAARDAARERAPLLPSLSAERVAAEMLKLLAAPDPLPVLALMREDGVLAQMLPEATAFDRLAALVALDATVDPLRRLGALAATDAAAAEAVGARLKLSRAERERLAAFAAPPWPVALDGDGRAQRRALYHLGAALYRDLVLLRATESGDADRARDLLTRADAWTPPRLPLKGRDVTARGIAAGPIVGQLLAEIEAWWEDGDFRADRAACRAELERRIGLLHG